MQYGNTALHEAAWNGNKDIVKSLLGAFCFVDSINHTGFTALHLASQNGHSKVVKTLLKWRADPGLLNQVRLYAPAKHVVIYFFVLLAWGNSFALGSQVQPPSSHQCLLCFENIHGYQRKGTIAWRHRGNMYQWIPFRHTHSTATINFPGVYSLTKTPLGSMWPSTLVILPQQFSLMT